MTTAEERRRADSLFAEALEKPPEERAAFLERSTAENEALRRAVERLLAAAEEDDTFLGERALGEGGALGGALWQEIESRMEARGGLSPGDRVGPFRAVREVGRGGMAVVYLAERVEGGFAQRVALKLVQPGRASESFLRRFELERQILASLSHPNIARLYEGGVTPDGRSWFAMELVDGEPIDAYCDRMRLPVEERLRLFAVVARAVQHAHRNLVVHRDLKPANILVSEEGEIKLLDFGIAKLTDPEAQPEEGPLTRTTVRVMTPEYASPEQVRGEAVTTSSDVYQLGLLLFELLTGQRAYRLEDRSLREVERLICEQAPTRPSAALTRGNAARGDAARGDAARGDATRDGETPSSEAVSRARATSPDKLRRRLRGDLDDIVLKALRKEPEWRYGSASRMVEDVERSLAGLPVEARGGTLSYRGRKFLARHRWSAAAAALFLFLGLAWAVSATVQARLLARERDSARFEAAKAREVKELLLDVFAGSDPAEARGREVTARELLDHGAGRIRRKLPDQPAVRAELLGAIGQVYRGLGLYDEARPLLDEALDLARGLAGETPHPLLARLLVQRARLHKEESELDEAAALLEEALEAERSLGLEASSEHADTLAELGLLTFERGSLEVGERITREALDLQRTLHGPRHPKVAASLNRLAQVVFLTGRREESEALLAGALEIHREALGPDHPESLEGLVELAFVRYQREDTEGAEALLDEAFEAGQRVLGPDHPQVLDIRLQRGNLFFAQGDLEGAEAEMRAVLERRLELFGPAHVETITTFNDLAVLLQARGDLGGAEALYQRALDGNRQLFGTVHLRVANNHYNLASLLSGRRDYRRAEAHHREALEIRLRLLAEDHPSVARSRASLGLVQVASGQVTDAEEQLEKAVATYRRVPPEPGTDAGRPLVALGWVLLDAGRPAEALPHLEEALASRLGADAEGSARVAEARMALGACLATLGREQEAEPLLDQGLGVLSDRLAPDHWLLVRGEKARSLLGGG